MLILPIKKKCFDMIKSRKKKEITNKKVENAIKIYLRHYMLGNDAKILQIKTYIKEYKISYNKIIHLITYTKGNKEYVIRVETMERCIW